MPRGVAGVQPAVGEGGRRRLGLVPVAGRDVGALDPELADLALRHVVALGRRRCGSRCASSPCRPSRPCGSRRRHRAWCRPGWSRSCPSPGSGPRRAPVQPSRMASGTGRAADAGDPQAREIGVCELRVLHHELVGRRHAEEVGDAERCDRRCSRAPGRDRRRA